MLLMFILGIQAVVSVLLITVILMQAKGTGLGSAWGGGSGSYHSKRGAEKVLFRLTIGLAVSFVFLALLLLV